MTEQATQNRALDPRRIYVAHDRFVCVDCAGYTALHTGFTLGGLPVMPLMASEVHEWPAELGPLRCECGSLEATLDLSGRRAVVVITAAAQPLTGLDVEPEGWDEAYEDLPCCSICDGAGHGYPGGGPCPLEVNEVLRYETDQEEAFAASFFTDSEGSF